MIFWRAVNDTPAQFARSVMTGFNAGIQINLHYIIKRRPATLVENSRNTLESLNVSGSRGPQSYVFFWCAEKAGRPKLADW